MISKLLSLLFLVLCSLPASAEYYAHNTLKWNSPSEGIFSGPDEVAGYRLYFAVDGGIFWTLVADKPCRYSTHFVESVQDFITVWKCPTWFSPPKVLTLPPSGISIQFHITSYNTAGESGPSNVVSDIWYGPMWVLP